MEKKLQNFLITRSNFLRIISLTIVVGFLFSLTNTMGQGSKANFSGSWTLNESKSTMPQGGGGMRMGGSSFVVTQAANLLTRTSTGQDGTQRVTKYTLDGKESVNTSARGDSKSVATWSSDGKTLNIKTTRTTQNGEMKSSEAWSMPDGKTLSILSVSAGRDGTERKVTMVYDKK